MSILSIIFDFAALVIDLIRLINELSAGKKSKKRNNRRPDQR